MSKNTELKHLGIILDGNRRFAKRLMKEPFKGHEYGAEKIERLLEWCEEFKIPQITLYTFSIENFNRPEVEKKYLCELFKKEFAKLKKREDEAEKKDIKIRFIGRKDLFPKDLQQIMLEVEEKTKNNKKMIVNFAMPYGGRAEIVDAVKKIVEQKLKPEDISEETLQKNMYITDDVDLVIRTSGEKRISGFLLWQGAYAEFIFIDKLWPEFEKQDLIDSIQEFNNRKRRFGQ